MADNNILSISQLNAQIRQLIEGQLSTIWIQGEISNFKPHSSGHYYFSLKDKTSQISAVMFRGYNSRLTFKPHDGLEVVARGKISVYEPRGSYQIVCEMMEPVGAGALQKAFEQLKEKLKKEGLFESAKKRPLPTFPKHIALVTSPTGAAIRDMLNIIERRNRSVSITVVPTIVQGATAAPQIVEALDKAYRLPNLDAVIVGRGGGSMEDLWAFNDEALARKIAASPVPIISAVGHEIDFTIADFVADLRAPTPSAAAELMVKSSTDIVDKLRSLDRMLSFSFSKKLKTIIARVSEFEKRLVDPRRKLVDLRIRNDELIDRLKLAVVQSFQKKKFKTQWLRDRLPHPKQIILVKKNSVQGLQSRLTSSVGKQIERRQFRLKNAVSLMNSLSPLQVLERSYAIASVDGKIPKAGKDVKVGSQMEVRFSQFQVVAEVKKVLDLKKEE